MTTKQTDISAKVTGKILITGTIRNTTPLIMGKGEGVIIDKEVVRGYGGVPYIPATAFVGVLKAYCQPDLTDKKLGYFWGWGKDSDCQSHFIVDDLCPVMENSSLKTVVRDGIRIDPKTGIVEDKKKFNYEVVEPDNRFSIRCEITLRGSLGFHDFKDTIAEILGALKNGSISFGAMTTRGFGKVGLENDWKVYHFDFANNHGLSWLEYMASGDLPADKQVSGLTLSGSAGSSGDLIIEGAFRLKSAIMVGAYPSDPGMPDKVHIKSGGKYVLPGTSIRGAVRTRAEKIINTLGGNGEEMLKSVFGWVNDEKKERAIKSRIIIEERIIENVLAEIQSRIRIDRFTGGTADTALFDSMPLWCSAECPHVYIHIRMPGYSQEDRWIAGLLFQVLKDFWTADLPIGGEKSIGRGVLQGKTARIALGKTGDCTIEQGQDGLIFTGMLDKSKLTECAAALDKKFPGQGGKNA
jgi:CRISPR/Cas system CSM-associated protein Csm3 (group 7 of RAMP superfamily)